MKNLQWCIGEKEKNLEEVKNKQEQVLQQIARISESLKSTQTAAEELSSSKEELEETLFKVEVSGFILSMLIIG